MQGIVINYHKDKGYGFIKVPNEESNIFVHIKAVNNANILEVGQKVEFELEETSKGLSAINVQAGSKAKSPYFTFSVVAFILTFSLFALLSSYVVVLLSYFLAINITTFLFYGYDKSISNGEKLRIPETVLHTLALLGGSPAALMAQRFFRHKTVKGTFQIIYWLIVLIQIGLLSFLA